jgi:hypothetical protein
MNVQLMRSSLDPPYSDTDQNEMIIAFFVIHPDGDYKLKQIIRWLLDKYNFVYLTTKYGQGKLFLERLNSSISSLLNQFYTKESLIPKRNFERITKGNVYIYRALPKTSDLVLPKPVQTSFDYDNTIESRTEETTSNETVVNEPVADEPETFEDEETTSEKNCPLLEDILASDKINDPIQRIIDNYSNIDLFGIDQVQFTATKSGKKITITIANA